MTVTLDLPTHVENAYRAEAQARGLSLDAVVREVLLASQAAASKSGEVPPNVFEQGLGLFGSAEDSALLDEVVAIAYSERRRPGNPPLEL